MWIQFKSLYSDISFALLCFSGVIIAVFSLLMLFIFLITQV